jgi:hypothetical protein
MGFLDWIIPRRDELVASQPGNGAAWEPEENVDFYGLDLRQELLAHKAWRGQLQEILDGGSSKTLGMDDILQYEACKLGQWLQNAGKLHYGHLPEYEAVCVAHHEFHVCAAAVITHYLSGDTPQALKLFQTKFRSASNRHQLELVRLFTVAAR